jgi:hypothetical protein
VLLYIYKKNSHPISCVNFMCLHLDLFRPRAGLRGAFENLENQWKVEQSSKN